MNSIGALLGTNDVHLDVDVSIKEQLLEQIATLLAARHGLSKAQVLQGMTARERLGSTGLGQGVAIPHARMNQCAAPAAVFVRTRAAIAFDAPDGKPVSIFLGLIIPKQATEGHLQLLAIAAAMFSDRSFRDKLKACTDPGVARELLAAWSDSPRS